MPDVYPPRYKPWRGHREARVTSDELDSVLRLLRLSHPPGSEWRWGFNWLPGEPKRARVDCEDGIDLDAIVRKVKSGRRTRDRGAMPESLTTAATVSEPA